MKGIVLCKIDLLQSWMCSLQRVALQAPAMAGCTCRLTCTSVRKSKEVQGNVRRARECKGVVGWRESVRECNGVECKGEQRNVRERKGL